MATCTDEGDLLQPAKPLTPVDRSFVWQLQSGAAAGTPPCANYGQQYMWNTYSVVGNAVYAWYTVGVNMQTVNPKEEFLLKPDVDFYPAPGAASSSADADGPPASAVYEIPDRAEQSGLKLVHRNWHASNRCGDGVADAVAAGCVYGSAPSMTPSTVRSLAHGEAAFDLIVSHPILQATHTAAASAYAWVFLGELDKYASVNSRRFSNLQIGPQSLMVTVAGSVGEKVTVAALKKANEANAWQVVVKEVVVGSQGIATARF